MITKLVIHFSQSLVILIFWLFVLFVVGEKINFARYSDPDTAGLATLFMLPIFFVLAILLTTFQSVLFANFQTKNFSFYKVVFTIQVVTITAILGDFLADILKLK